MAVYSQKLRRYFSNTSWLFIERAFRIGLGSGITIWMARYLGPQNFGTYSFAYSFVMFFSILSNLGLAKLLPRELIQNPPFESEIMGSSILLTFIGGLTLWAITIPSIMMLRPGNHLIHVMAAIFSSTFLFKSTDVIRYYYETHVQIKYSAPVAIIAFSISVFITAVLILVKAPVVTFPWAVFAESVFSAIGLFWVYRFLHHHTFSWKASWKQMAHLLKEAWPLILAGGLYTFYTGIGSVMLGKMVGDEAVGIYAAAVKISAGWLIIPNMIATSLYPTLLTAKRKNLQVYYERLQHYLNSMAVLGVMAAIIFTCLANPGINLIFGARYSQSAMVLVIHGWGGIFVCLSAISYLYFISEGLQKYSLYRTLTGAVINVLLNLLLIPAYGAVGAAVATAISQVIALYLVNAINPESRPAFIMQTKALTLVGALDTLRWIRSLK